MGAVLLTEGQLIFLNVGCGPAGSVDRIPSYFRSPGWREVRLDIDPRVRPDIVASITDMSCVPANSVDCVWSSHNLEHLYDHEVAHALREFLRILKPTGFAYLKVPDLHAIAELIVADRLDDVAYESAAGSITPLDMIYGHRASLAAGNDFMAHRTGFTPRVLERALSSAGFGFGVLKRQTYMELSALVFKMEPDDVVRDKILAELSF